MIMTFETLQILQRACEHVIMTYFPTNSTRVIRTPEASTGSRITVPTIIVPQLFFHRHGQAFHRVSIPSVLSSPLATSSCDSNRCLLRPPGHTSGTTIGRDSTLRASAASGGASGAGSGSTRRLSVSACRLNQKNNNNNNNNKKAMKRL